MVIGRYIKKTLKAIIKWSMVTESEAYQDPIPVPYSGAVGMKSSSSSSGTSISNGTNGMHFTVYNATGGKVIETRTYDPRTDRNNSNLYVITDKEELGEELAQIITKESLCR